MALTTNKTVLNWVDEMAKMTTPDNIVWIDGSKKQLDELTAQSLAAGEIIELNQEKLPGCYLHRTAVNDVARVEHRTFICSREEKNAGPTNNWMDPKEAYAMMTKLFTGSNEGPHNVCYPLLHGRCWLTFCQSGRRAYRLYICCSQHEHNDTHRQGCFG